VSKREFWMQWSVFGVGFSAACLAWNIDESKGMWALNSALCLALNIVLFFYWRHRK
jgi:hypothetical protein